MKTLKDFAMAAMAVAMLAALPALEGCSSVPVENARLSQARSDYTSLQGDAQMQRLVPAELKQASDALMLAEGAQARRDDSSRVDQLAYLAGQRVTLAREAGNRRVAEESVTAAAAERDSLRLAARTNEADAATRSATAANRNAAAANQNADTATRIAMAASRDAANSQLQTQMAQQQAGDADMRSAALQSQLRDLQAKKTDRGMVVTLGDVLFDTGRAELKAGGVRNLQRLGVFLKTYPQRKALIEGYTDSVGSESSNLSLSGRRADAVMAALLAMGVSNSQLAAQGYGEAQPVAGNGTSGGRQMNRRVEVVLSDENGNVAPR